MFGSKTSTDECFEWYNICSCSTPKGIFSDQNDSLRSGIGLKTTPLELPQLRSCTVYENFYNITSSAERY